MALQMALQKGRSNLNQWICTRYGWWQL